MQNSGTPIVKNQGHTILPHFQNVATYIARYWCYTEVRACLSEIATACHLLLASTPRCQVSQVRHCLHLGVNANWHHVVNTSYKEIN